MIMQGNAGRPPGASLRLYTYKLFRLIRGSRRRHGGRQFVFVGFADLLGNGETQMVMQQNNGELLAVQLPVLRPIRSAANWSAPSAAISTSSVSARSALRVRTRC